ncbi:MAG: hypothetical protein AAF368_00840 [Planctomycetota bacterium]
MNALNGFVTKLFDVVLSPFEALGFEWALILVSGVFGILALIAFKYISYQKGIKAAKDKIKGHLIAVRLYQNDLGIVAKSVFKVLARNLQYLGLNFGPFVPLAIPFVFVLAQLVTRYAFDPIPVESVVVNESAEGRTSAWPVQRRAGLGTVVRIEMAKGSEERASELAVELPEGLRATSAFVRNGRDGVAFQEFVATNPGEYDIAFTLPDGTRETKRVVAGTRARKMQPERVKGTFTAVLWPAEDKLPSDSPFEHIAFEYPESALGWLPGVGLGGVLLVFLVASMLFGVLVLKPLGIQI